MKRLAIPFAFALFFLLPTTVAAADCQFVLGFKTLRDLVGHEIVGECLENEHYNHIGDSVQQTTGGLLVWRKADNWTAFTDGYRSWVNGPYGLEQRFNIELLPWEAEGAIERLPWVQDGVTDLENRAVTALETLGMYYSQVLLALLEKEKDWLPPQHSNDITHLNRIVEMSSLNETATRQIVLLPFLEELNSQDTFALQALLRLLSSNIGGVDEIVSDRRLKDSRTETDAVIILLLVLRAQDPEAAAKMESMLWVRDGIASVRHSTADPEDGSRYEQSLVRKLVDLAGRSRAAYLALAEKPWLQDGLTRYEFQLAGDLSRLAEWDSTWAHRVANMPFMQSIEGTESTIIQTIQDFHYQDDTLPARILSHPAFAGGITDAQTAEVYLVVTEIMAPQGAAAVRAFTWVQDGVAASELAGLQSLQIVGSTSDRVLQALAQKHWVQDGISEEELETIRLLYAILGWHWSRYQHEALALRIIEMPFLNTIDDNDFRAMRKLRRLHRDDDGSQLARILSHPKLRNGITDDLTGLVAGLPVNVDAALRVLDSRQ